MAFPIVESRHADKNGDWTPTDLTSHPITFPSGVQAGETLAVVFTVDATPTISIDTGVSGGDWNRAGQVNGTASSTPGSDVFWKTAEGGGADALSLNTSSAQQSSYVSFRISGSNGTLSVLGVGGNGANSDPPSLTPAGGAKDYLWIAARGGDCSSELQATAPPTNYGNFTYTDPDQTANGGTATATAERNLNASSENPGAFTVATEQFVAWTIAVHPAEASGAEGSLSKTLDDVTVSASGALEISGALSQSLAPLTLSGSGALLVSAVSSVNLQPMGVSGSGALIVSGGLSSLLEDTLLSSTGVLAGVDEGVLSVTLDDLGVLLTGALRLNAGLSSILDDLTLNSAGALRLSGYLSTTLADTIVEAVGTLISGPHGSLSVTLENISVEAVGSVIVTSVAEISLELLSINASGALEISGELVVTLDELISVASGYEPGTIVRVPRRAVLSPRLSLSGRIVLAGRLKI